MTSIAGRAMPHERDQDTCAEVTIRPFEERDASRVRELFITVNRLLSPPKPSRAGQGRVDKHHFDFEMFRINVFFSPVSPQRFYCN
jgi:hypothetical protein